MVIWDTLRLLSVGIANTRNFTTADPPESALQTFTK